MNAQLTEHRHLDELSAHMRELIARAYAKGEREGRRQGFAMLESSCAAAKQEGIVIGEARAMRGQIAAAAIWVCVGIVFAIIGGPVVAGWLT